MNVDDLAKDVIRLGWEWDLYQKSTEETRLAKVREEALELVEAIDSGVEANVLMESGDVIVTLINWLYPKGAGLDWPLSMAHEKNCKKTGRMVNGTFVKDGDK
jgi:NTP pyrophosphatase (non-canonical NTP hydrolase)